MHGFECLSDIKVSLPFAKCSFVCRLEKNAFLPAYKGSTFRGVFGHALKKISCGLSIKECANCAIAYNCLYANVFEAIKKEEGKPTQQHPYLIEPSEDVRREYLSGEEFSFNLILFGKYAFDIPYFIYAIIEMGKIGIGKRGEDGERTPFSLESVQLNGIEIFSHNQETVDNVLIKENVKKIDADFFKESQVNFEISNLTLELRTPLRFKNNNCFNKTDLSFILLIKNILRRLSTLFASYANESFYLPFAEMFSEAEKIQIKNSELYWEDWRRYSQRQEQEMLMGGMLGKIEYVGSLEKFVPLLKLAELIHIGKQTSFGLGKISCIF